MKADRPWITGLEAGIATNCELSIRTTKEKLMNRTLITAVALSAALALSAAAYSQGRHDEKPHGMKPAAAESTDKAAATGGRHDSGPTTHGPAKKAATKKGKDVDGGSGSK
jgi:hypothetical protein